MKDIEKKGELKLLGVTLHEEPCSWDTHLTHFDHTISKQSKASSRLYILRVCKYFGYYLQELTQLFYSLIMSLFSYAIKVWALCL